ncbi:hypothetical protein I4U23_002618 [Adineta vaga]|nr:hypothetical protein I4U23_002618 [Adineta vaga]
MLSAAANPITGGDSSMPGDYEPFLGGPPRNPPVPGSLGPPRRTSIPQLSAHRTPGISPTRAPPMGEQPMRTPFPRLPATSPIIRPPMRHSHAAPYNRPIRIRRHRRRPLTPDIVVERRSHRHSSFGRRHVITVPLDCRPTLGLRGPPTRVLELERVRCRRSRRRRSPCYDYDHGHDHPPQPPQQTTFVANPIPNICLPVANQTAIPARSAVLSNLSPEMLRSLPRQTVHLEPIHLPGSQANANTELDTITFPVEIINPVDGTLSIIQANSPANGIGISSIPTTGATPLINSAPLVSRRPPMSSSVGPNATRQRFLELFQRLSLPRTQQMASTATLPTNNQSTLSPMSRPNPPTTIPSNNASNVERNSSINISPVNPSNNRSYQTPSIAPYQTTTFTPSRSVHNTTYRPTNSTPSNPSSVGPYRPANITPFGSNTTNRYGNNQSLQSSFTSGPSPYASAASIASTNSFTTFPSASFAPSRTDNNHLNLSSSSPSLLPTSFQPTNSTPKSILRNTPSNNYSSNANTHSNSSNVFSPNDTVQKSTRFA